MRKVGLVIGIIFFIMLSMVSCKEKADNLRAESNSLSMVSDEQREGACLEYSYEEGTFDLNIKDDFGVYTEDAVPDAETASLVAQAIFNGMKKSSEAKEFQVQRVIYDVEKKVWVVEFFSLKKTEGEIMTAGYVCYIAIKKENAEVVRIWFEE